MHAEGRENVFARHEACAAAARAGLAALDFALFADPPFASKTVTAVSLPEGHDWKVFNTAIKSHGVVLAGGQGKLTGKIFRLGHLGSVTVDEILGAIAVLERVAVEQGRPIQPGRAVSAAQAAALAVQTGGAARAGGIGAVRGPNGQPSEASPATVPA
jgi:aspartate aminotransferase-like enzyme